jgi:hypothetical protein
MTSEEYYRGQLDLLNGREVSDSRGGELVLPSAGSSDLSLGGESAMFRVEPSFLGVPATATDPFTGGSLVLSTPRGVETTFGGGPEPFTGGSLVPSTLRGVETTFGGGPEPLVVRVPDLVRFPEPRDEPGFRDESGVSGKVSESLYRWPLGGGSMFDRRDPLGVFGGGRRGRVGRALRVYNVATVEDMLGWSAGRGKDKRGSVKSTRKVRSKSDKKRKNTTKHKTSGKK